jgi:hypothetical protein
LPVIQVVELPAFPPQEEASEKSEILAEALASAEAEAARLETEAQAEMPRHDAAGEVRTHGLEVRSQEPEARSQESEPAAEAAAEVGSQELETRSQALQQGAASESTEEAALPGAEIVDLPDQPAETAPAHESSLAPPPQSADVTVEPSLAPPEVDEKPMAAELPDEVPDSAPGGGPAAADLAAELETKPADSDAPSESEVREPLNRGDNEPKDADHEV